MGRRFLHNAFGQALVLIFLSLGLGVVVNLARPTPVPFDDTRAFPLLPTISLDRAMKALEMGESLFLDARPREFSDRGRILNAMALPLKSSEAEVRKALPNPHPYAKIIVYCEDEDCDAADAMARRLDRMGYEKVFVLEGGWRAWTQANLPTQ